MVVSPGVCAAPPELIAGLTALGYRGALLEKNYSFPDWFARQETRTLDVAAFGQVPASYESACIGVAQANGLRELALVNAFRAFGAPLLLEIDDDEVREWGVSRTADNHTLIGRYRASNLADVIAKRARDWTPQTLLRAKNIVAFKWADQLGLFAGLIPELESQIHEKLDPLLRDTVSRTSAAYVESTGKTPGHKALFRLVFWMLTAKVFRDRRRSGFATLSGNADDALTAVATHYNTDLPKLLNRESREAAAAGVWRELDFRNLSVEVLAHTWSRTLVDRDTRQRLGIHRTPRAIVRYIVERIPFPLVEDDDRIVFEPCSGSAAFLVGALNFLKSNLLLAAPEERHKYFLRHLAGMEYDAFGAEISTLALTLADFPNQNGWNITQADVFAPHAMTRSLNRAGVVLCNPPFESFSAADRFRYQTSEVRKPAELLKRVLADLHPSGVLGFVMPYSIVDGRAYANTRKLLAKRFDSLELTVLPERSFEDSDADIAVLIAKEPIPHSTTRVAFRRVHDDPRAWKQFAHEHIVSSDYTENVNIERASKGLVLADLPELWSFLSDYRQLGDIADIHRGVEWRSRIAAGRHVRSEPTEGYRLGVAPKTKFDAFQVPRLQYLNVMPNEQRRNSWKKYNWSLPKAIVPKARVSRQRWRMVAFADGQGVVCHHTFCGVWPKASGYDEDLLAAILNGPVANAFVATHEGWPRRNR